MTIDNQSCSHHNHINQSFANVLIVDTAGDFAQVPLRLLAKRGIRGIVVDDYASAIKYIEKDDYHLALGTVNLGEQLNIHEQLKPALGLMDAVKLTRPEMPVIMVADLKDQTEKKIHAAVEYATAVIRAGFSDLLIRPLSMQKLEQIISTYIPNHDVSTLATADEHLHHLYSIVGSSRKLLQTIELGRRIAPTSAPVLITGETGTGKELISYMIHRQSKRANGPYVRVNCAALSESLLESELFGHEKGAFTGAYTQRKGRFETAHGGTLLLDEITETPPKLQAKLLRILEQQDFERVGGNDNIKVNVRIISTTNRDLKKEVAEDNFRPDLYYRLCGVKIVVAPLRERKEDIYDLTWHFVNLCATEVSRKITKLDPAMMEIFNNYHWPGNVRQLRNVVRTSMILGSGRTLSLADVSWLFDELQPKVQHSIEHTEILTSPNKTQPPPNDLAGIPLSQVEKRAILETLRQTQGNQTKAAKALGISDRTLRCKIKKYRQEGVLQPA